MDSGPGPRLNALPVTSRMATRCSPRHRPPHPSQLLMSLGHLPTPMMSSKGQFPRQLFGLHSPSNHGRSPVLTHAAFAPPQSHGPLRASSPCFDCHCRGIQAGFCAGAGRRGHDDAASAACETRPYPANTRGAGAQGFENGSAILEPTRTLPEPPQKRTLGP